MDLCNLEVQEKARTVTKFLVAFKKKNMKMSLPRMP